MPKDVHWIDGLRKGWLRLGADVTALFCGRLPRVFAFSRGFKIGRRDGSEEWDHGQDISRLQMNIHY